jgi:glycosyltransferase involved in cell wall biosynthesis
MDLLYSASRGEGFGLVLIEAMASGVPVLAVEEGGVTDVIEDGVNGFSVRYDQGWYRRLAAVIHELLRHPELRHQIVENGLTTVRTKFTWEIVLPKYRELLRLNQTSPAPPP